MSNKNQTKQEKLKIVCPFCNEPYNAEMEEEFENTTNGCESCGLYQNDLTFKIIIKCSKCGKVIYVKEGTKDLLD